MRLPQDRILHIDTEFKDGKVNVVAEWQGELVRCKDCIYWFPHTQCGFDEDNDEYHDYCGLLIPDDDYYAYTRKPDDYCSYGERIGGEEE